MKQMELDQEHREALAEAEGWLFHSDYCPYLELKQLLRDSTPRGRQRFRVLFTSLLWTQRRRADRCI